MQNSTPPQVTSTSPSSNLNNVSVVTNQIQVTFDEPLNTGTVTNSTFTVKKSSNNSSVSGTVSANDSSATFTVNGYFEPFTQYTVRLTTDIRDVGGTRMSNNYSWNFTTSFDSNLPIIIVNTNGVTVPDEPKIPATMQVLWDQNGGRNYLSSTAYQLTSSIGIEQRGQSSQSDNFLKKQYGVETQDANGDDRNVSLLGLPSESDWVFNGPFSDKTLMRNVVAYALSNNIGRYAPRTQYFELFLDANNDGQVNQDDYVGVYVLIEKIKRDGDRVDIAKLTDDDPQDNVEPNVTGGYIIKVDPYDNGDAYIYDSGGASDILFSYPKSSKITSQQTQYMRDYTFDVIDAFNDESTFDDPKNGYTSLVNVDSFVDHMILRELLHDLDGYRRSTYFYKDRGGELYSGPLWDANLTLGNSELSSGYKINGWNISIDYSIFPFKQLRKDGCFTQRFVERWNELRQDEFTTSNLTALVNANAQQLEEAQVRDHKKFIRLGVDIWPNYYYRSFPPSNIPVAQQDVTYAMEVDFMRWWLINRAEWMDNNINTYSLNSPPDKVCLRKVRNVITDEGGGIDRFNVALSQPPSADVAISISSQDPGEGVTNINSLTFTPSNWYITQEVEVMGVADGVQDGTQDYTISLNPNSGDNGYNNLPNLTVTVQNLDSQETVWVNEVLAHTDPPALDTIELHNPTGNSIDIGHWYISDDKNTPRKFSIPVGTIIPAGGYLLFDESDFNADPSVITSFAFSSAGDEVYLTAANSAGALTGYSHGFSFGASETDVSFARYVTSTGAEHFVAQSVNSLGVANAYPKVGPVIISEVMYNPSTGDDFLELINITNDPVALFDPANPNNRWKIDGLGGYTFPANTTIPANGLLLVVPIDPATFRSTYNIPSTVQIVGPYTGSLNDGGENIALRKPDTPEIDGSVIYFVVDEVTYSPDSPWPTVPNGNGPALERIECDKYTNDPINWTASINGGTPGVSQCITPGVSVGTQNGATTGEDGASTTFTLLLDKKPVANVTIPLSVSDDDEATVSPTSLTFTPNNWDTPQTVTVTGKNDAVADGDMVYAVIIGAATSNDGGYNGLDADDISFTNLDDGDAVGIIVSQTTGLVTSEAGGTDTFTIKLASSPTADVTISLNSSNTSEGTASPAALTFTPSTWHQPQSVTVTGVDDNISDGPVAYTIVTEPASSADPGYAGLDSIDVAVTNSDDDNPGIIIDPTNGLTTDETGLTATFNVQLASQPLENVRIDLASSDPTEGTPNSTSLVFTSVDWNSPKSVTVTGQDDSISDGDITYNIVTAASVSSDESYSGLDSADVALTNNDDDNPAIIVSAADSQTTAETDGSATFSIRLASQPAADVSIGIVSSDPSEGVASPATVTFTASDWNQPQIINVIAMDDFEDDGDIAYTIRTNPASSSDVNYSGIDADDRDFTSIDNDVAGISVDAIVGQTTAESGESRTFTIVLDTQPTADVSIALSSSDSSEGSVSPAAVTFTPSNWNISKTVTVSGVDDDVDDGNKLYTIVTAAATSTDSIYDSVNPIDVDFANLDDDSAGIAVDPTGGLSTNEDGTTATFSVKLETEPTADVTIPLSSDNSGEGTVAPASITFTPNNWDTAQTITATGVDDNLDDGDVLYTITIGPASGDASYDNLTRTDIAITNIDDDASGIALNATEDLVTDESGTTATFTIVLNSQPSADVTIPLSSDNSGEGTVSPAAVTFTPSNWNTAQAITVTGVDDPVDDGDQVYTITTDAATSGDSAYAGLNPPDVSVINLDDDAIGITVSPTSGLVTDEAGATATFTLKLNSQPAADVTITLNSADDGEGSVGPASVIFSSSNWNAAQTVTVTGVDDDEDDGDITYSISTGAASSTDPLYSGLDAADVSVKNSDDDAAAITLNAAGGQTTNESGATATFSINLESQPTANVTINLTNSDPSEASLSTAALLFTPSNWSTPQTVTVSGANDSIDDGDVVYTIITGNALSTDANYNDYSFGDVVLTNIDDDDVGVSITPTSGLSTDESGTAANFTIQLESEPTADVTIALSSSNSGEGTVAPAAVTFTAGTWSTPQSVTVTGADDLIDDGDINYAITTAAATSTDAGYDGLDPADVTLTNIDDDSAAILVNPVSGLTTSESGSSASFNVVLGSQPTADVTIDLTSGDTGEVTIAPTTLTFTAGNWDAAQAITATGVNDAAQDGDQFVVIDTAAASSTDGNYSGLNAPDVTIANADDDVVGIFVNLVGGLNTGEDGTTTTVEIRLNTQPTADVIIPLSSSDTSEGVINPATLTFTPSNWDSVQLVTVTGVNDDGDDGDAAYALVTAAATSADGNYNAIDAVDVALVNLDNDEAGVLLSTAAPTLTTNEDGGSATLLVVLASQPTADVSFVATSSDSSEATVSPATLTFTPSSWNTPQNITVTGVDDELDDGTVSYVVEFAATTSADVLYDGLDLADLSANNADNGDSAGVTIINGSNGLTTDEAGGTAVIEVLLSSQPTADVEIDLSSSGPGEGTVAPTALLFTPSDWNTPQAVTVTGVDDLAADGDVNYTVVFENVRSADPTYNGVAVPALVITNEDNDSADIVVSPTSGIVLFEDATAGATAASIDVVLTSQPYADVLIEIAIASQRDATISPRMLTFTPSDWNSAKSITLTSKDDAVDDGDVNLTLILSAAESADLVYNSIDPADVSWTSIDNDTFGVTVTSGGATLNNLTTSEADGDTGSATSFSVVLESEPATDVEVPLSSSDQSEGEVEHTSLLFTAANWNQAQMVQVAGVDDAIADGDIGYSIVLAPIVSDDSIYSGLDVADISATNTDDDVAGIGVFAAAMITTTEGVIAAGAALPEFSIVLLSEPADDVIIPLASSDPSEGMPVPEQLIFTPTNWDAPQSVAIAGVNDNDIDGAIPYSIKVEPAVSTDGAYNGQTGADVAMINVDDDTAAVNVLTVAQLITDEQGRADMFEVVLNSRPADDVLIPLSTTNAAESQLSAMSLLFTPADWNMAQAVTVTGVDDNAIDGDTAYMIMVDSASSSDSNYDGVAGGVVNAINMDDDQPGIRIVTAAITTTSESDAALGNVLTFDVVLKSQPAAEVVIPLESSDPSEGMVEPTMLTFTPANWNVPQTVTVSGVDDGDNDGDVAYIIQIQPAISSDSEYSDLDADDVALTNLDNGDDLSITITADGAMVGDTIITNEGGSSASFSLVLDRQPIAAVTVTLSSSDPSEGTLAVETLTFTPDNWETPQSVTVTGVDDLNPDGDSSYAVIFDPIVSADLGFSGLQLAEIPLLNLDDDNARVLVGPPTGSVTTESGSIAEIQVVLTSQPASTITYRLYSTAVNEGVPSPSTLTFTPDNWEIPQTVTVTGVDDDIPDGDRTYRVALTADTLADSLYAGWDAGSAELTNLDDDIVSYSATIDSGLSEISTTEEGGSDTLTVVLDSQPQSDVVISITSLDPGEGKVVDAEGNTPDGNNLELLFTPETWNEAQVVTIQGVDDDNQDGDVAYTLLVRVTAGDANFYALPQKLIDAVNLDDGLDGSTQTNGLIEGVVWYDLDRDNVFDGDELVLQNQKVTRTWAGPNGAIGDADDLNYLEYTDEDGRFKFTSATAGLHRIQVIFEELTIAGSSTYTSTFDIPLQVDEQYSNAYMRVLGNDFDSDGIDNETEGADDFDGDGKPNYADIDSDDDGFLDVQEGTIDVNDNGQVDYLDPTTRPDMELLESDVEPDADSIMLTWTTLNESPQFEGFHLWRGTTLTFDSAERITPQMIAAQGDGTAYVYDDTAAESGVAYIYWLEPIPTSPLNEITSITAFVGIFGPGDANNPPDGEEEPSNPPDGEGEPDNPPDSEEEPNSPLAERSVYMPLVLK